MSDHAAPRAATDGDMTRTGAIHRVGPVAVSNAETWELESAHGVRYRLQVAWPAQPAPVGGYPVIYQLDGDATFVTTVESMRTRAHRADATGVAPSIVVGVAPVADLTDDLTDTLSDHTASGADVIRRRQMLRADDFTPSLGASRFRVFLASVVQPAVASAFPVNVARATLIGHSLGGLFVLDTLLDALHRGASDYDTYVAISPSIWRGGDALWQTVAALSATSLAPRLAAQLRVLLTVGEYEQALAPWQRDADNAAEILERRRLRRMVDQTREFADRLTQSVPALGVQCWVFAGEDHASVVLPTMSEALRLAGAAR